jgi:hypothetical protein
MDEVKHRAEYKKEKNRKPRNSVRAWKQVEDIFHVVSGSVSSSATPPLAISEEELETLFNFLSLTSSWKVVCSITERRQPSRIHFIAPIILAVCASFKGDAQILAEEVIRRPRSL